MKSLLLATIASALRLYAGAGLFDRIRALVLSLILDETKTGAEKMAQVLAFVEAEAMGLGTTLVRAIVEVVLLQARP